MSAAAGADTVTLPSGSLFHYAVTFTPAERRPAANAVCSFAQHMHDLGRLSPEVQPAKLAWWHEELERTQNANPRHPVTRELCAHMDEVPTEALNLLLHAAVIEANQVHLDDDAAIDRYLSMRGGALYTALEATAGGDDAGFCSAAGTAHAGVEWLAASGQQPMPSPRGRAAGVVLRPRITRALGELTQHRGRSVTAAVLIEYIRRWWPTALMATATAPPGPWIRVWSGWHAARNQLARR